MHEIYNLSLKPRNPTMILPLAHPSSSTHKNPLSYAQATGNKNSGASQSTLAQIKHRISSPPPTMDRIKENLTAAQLSPGNYVNKLAGLVSYDITSGDCSLSHLQMKLLLELDEVTKEIKWDLMCVDRNHTFLCGVSITGSIFLLDVGTLKYCRRLERLSSTVCAPTPRVGYYEPNPAKIKAHLTKDKCEIQFKVSSFTRSN
jgi:hypothetical protein